MDAEARAELAARRIVLRLEELGRALASADVAPEAATRALEATAVATMHAVSLELLTAARAERIWNDSGQQLPELPAPPVGRAG